MFSFLVQIFFLLKVKVVSLVPFFIVMCRSTLTSAGISPVHDSVRVKASVDVGIVPDADMFNFGAFKATEFEDSIVIVYGS